jgi:hypothetical protein
MRHIHRLSNKQQLREAQYVIHRLILAVLIMRDAYNQILNNVEPFIKTSVM